MGEASFAIGVGYFFFVLRVSRFVLFFFRKACGFGIKKGGRERKRVRCEVSSLGRGGAGV